MNNKHIIYLLPVIALLTSCHEVPNISIQEHVTLTFIQHDFLGWDEKNGEIVCYFFKNNVICTTKFIFDKGYYLTQEDIFNFNVDNLNYEVPKLNGDGYFSLTFYVTEFEEETGIAKNFLEPMYLNEDMTIHFAIYG